MSNRIEMPAGYAPVTAMAFGATGTAATMVDAAHPLPVTVQGAAPAAPAQVTIAAGDSLSGAIDLGEQRLHQILLPASWSAAAISFQVSAGGTGFADLYDVAGEQSVPAAVAGAGRAIVVDPAVFHGIRHVRLRSGTAGAPVVQAAARTLTLVTVPR